MLSYHSSSTLSFLVESPISTFLMTVPVLTKTSSTTHFTHFPLLSSLFMCSSSPIYCRSIRVISISHRLTSQSNTWSIIYIPDTPISIDYNLISKLYTLTYSPIDLNYPMIYSPLLLISLSSIHSLSYCSPKSIVPSMEI